MAIKFKYDATGVVIPKDKEQQKFGQQLVLNQQKYANDQRQNIFEQQKQNNQNAFNWNLAAGNNLERGQQATAQQTLRGQQALAELNAQQTFGVQQKDADRALKMQDMGQQRDLGVFNAQVTGVTNMANDALKNPNVSLAVKQQIQALIVGKGAVNSTGWSADQKQKYLEDYQTAIKGHLDGIPPTPSMEDKYNQGVMYRDPKTGKVGKIQQPDSEVVNLNDGSSKSAKQQTKLPERSGEYYSQNRAELKKDYGNKLAVIQDELDDGKLMEADGTTPKTKMSEEEMKTEALRRLDNDYNTHRDYVNGPQAPATPAPVGQAPVTPGMTSAPVGAPPPAVPLPNPQAVEDALGLTPNAAQGEPAAPQAVPPVQEGQPVPPQAAPPVAGQPQAAAPGQPVPPAGQPAAAAQAAPQAGVMGQDHLGEYKDATAINWSEQPVGTRMMEKDGKMYVKTARSTWELSNPNNAGQQIPAGPTPIAEVSPPGKRPYGYFGKKDAAEQAAKIRKDKGLPPLGFRQLPVEEAVAAPAQAAEETSFPGLNQGGQPATPAPAAQAPAPTVQEQEPAQGQAMAAAPAANVPTPGNPVTFIDETGHEVQRQVTSDGSFLQRKGNAVQNKDGSSNLRGGMKPYGEWNIISLDESGNEVPQPGSPTGPAQVTPPSYVPKSVESLQKEKAALEKYMGLNKTILDNFAKKDIVTETAENFVVPIGDKINAAVDALGGPDYSAAREKDRAELRPKQGKSIADQRTQLQIQQSEAKKKIAALDEQIKIAQTNTAGQAAVTTPPVTPAVAAKPQAPVPIEDTIKVLEKGTPEEKRAARKSIDPKMAMDLQQQALAGNPDAIKQMDALKNSIEKQSEYESSIQKLMSADPNEQLDHVGRLRQSVKDGKLKPIDFVSRILESQDKKPSEIYAAIPKNSYVAKDKKAALNSLWDDMGMFAKGDSIGGMITRATQSDANEEKVINHVAKQGKMSKEDAKEYVYSEILSRNFLDDVMGQFSESPTAKARHEEVMKKRNWKPHQKY